MIEKFVRDSKSSLLSEAVNPPFVIVTELLVVSLTKYKESATALPTPPRSITPAPDAVDVPAASAAPSALDGADVGSP